MKYFLGIDGGGTKTDLLLADHLGKIKAEAEAGPTSLVAVGAKQAQQNLAEGLAAVTAELEEQDEIELAVFGLASVDTDQEEQQAAELFQDTFSQFPVNQFAVINDAIPALVNATELENAIVLVAGTGSNCYGENEQGDTAKVSGLDYLLADQGSAYDIGSKVLRAAAKSYDGRGPKSVLEDKLCQYFEVDRFENLKSKIYRPNLNKRQIAQLSQLWLEALEENDEVAEAIFDWEADELWLMVITMVEHLDLAQTKFELVLEGSLAQSPRMVQYLSRQLKQFNSQAEIVLPHQPAVHGALKMALGK